MHNSINMDDKNFIYVNRFLNYFTSKENTFYDEYE